MNIPARIRILAGIQPGSVFYFEDEEFTSTEPHYFVVLNNNPKTDELLILVSASSQVDKRKNVAKKLGFSPETLVVVSVLEYPFFTKETIFDCNRAKEKKVQSLIDKLAQNKLKVCTEFMPKKIAAKTLIRAT